MYLTIYKVTKNLILNCKQTYYLFYKLYYYLLFSLCLYMSAFTKGISIFKRVKSKYLPM